MKRLIMGTSSYLKLRHLDGLKKKYADCESHEFECDQFDTFSSLASSTSFFKTQRLLILYEVGNLSKKESKRLEEILSKDLHHIILVTSDKARQKGWVKSLVPTKDTWIGDKPKSWEYARWVESEATQMGLSLPSGYSDALVLNVGEDLCLLRNELLKLRIFCGKRTVNSDDIDLVLYQHTTFSPFDIVRQWGLKQTSDALTLFGLHFQSIPDAERVRSVLVLTKTFLDRIENLLIALDMSHQGSGVSEITKVLGVSSYIYTKNIQPQVKARNKVALEDAYLEMAEIERKLKRGSDGKMLIEAFILKH